MELVVHIRRERCADRALAARIERRQTPEMVSIHVRLPEIEGRLMLGCWEGNLINVSVSSVGVLVERTSGYLILVTMSDATATSVMAGFSAALNGMPLAMRKSMACDQDREMARHAWVAQKAGVAIYICNPCSPWQRGSNENIAGLIRQYLPGGTGLSLHRQEELDAIVLQPNMRPRKRFDFKCPVEVMGGVMQKPSLCGKLP